MHFSHHHLCLLVVVNGTVEKLSVEVHHVWKCIEGNSWALSQSHSSIGWIFTFHCWHHVSIAFGDLEELGNEGLVQVVDVEGGQYFIGFRHEGHFEHKVPTFGLVFFDQKPLI